MVLSLNPCMNSISYFRIDVKLILVVYQVPMVGAESGRGTYFGSGICLPVQGQFTTLSIRLERYPRNNYTSRDFGNTRRHLDPEPLIVGFRT